MIDDTFNEKPIPEEWFKAAEAVATHCGCSRDIGATIRAVWPLIARPAFKDVLEMLSGEAFYDGVALKDLEISEDYRFKKLKRCVQSAAQAALHLKQES